MWKRNNEKFYCMTINWIIDLKQTKNKKISKKMRNTERNWALVVELNVKIRDELIKLFDV